MRLLLLGTGGFAVPTLRAVAASRHELLGLLTQPQRQAQGRRAAPESPARVVARDLGLPVFDPASINSDEARALLAQLAPELLVVCDYGQILSPATLAVPRLGGINLHGSLLPR